MDSVHHLDSAIQSSILTLLGVKSAIGSMDYCFKDTFISCSDAKRIQKDLKDPKSMRAVNDLHSLLERIGAQDSPNFVSDSEDIPLLIHSWYTLDLCSQCVLDCIFRCSKRHHDDTETSDIGRAFAFVIVIALLFSSILLGVRNIVLFAKSAKRSHRLLSFILKNHSSTKTTPNQRLLLINSAKEAYKAEKSYMRTKLLFGVLDLVLSAGLIALLVAAVLATTSVVYLGGVLSCLTIIGLSLTGLASFLYLPLLVFESRTRKKSAVNIEKALCFYLIAKQDPDTFSNVNVNNNSRLGSPSPRPAGSRRGSYYDRSTDRGTNYSDGDAPTATLDQTRAPVCMRDEQRPSPSAPPPPSTVVQPIQQDTHYDAHYVGNLGTPLFPRTPVHEIPPMAPPPSYEDLERAGAFNNTIN